jgi:hypothetical protein
MKRVLTVVLGLAFLAYLGGAASAAEIVKQGSERIEITASADYGTSYGDVNSTTETFGVAGEYGYMVLDQFELAARALIALTQSNVEGTAGGNYRAQNYALDLIPKWRPPLEGNISPFIGPKIGVRYVTNSFAANSPTGTSSHANDTVIEWGAVLGADIFLSKQTALVVEYDFTHYSVDSTRRSLGLPGVVPTGTTSGHISVNDNALTVGLAYWW